jgi:hypothetical protein
MKVNKAEKIREAFNTLGVETRPKDVIAHLAANKIKVPASQVSAIKAKLGTKPGRKGKSQGGLALQDLLAAKKLIESIGSIERARDAIEALAKLS